MPLELCTYVGSALGIILLNAFFLKTEYGKFQIPQSILSHSIVVQAKENDLEGTALY